MTSHDPTPGNRAAAWKRAAKRMRATAKEALALSWAWVHANEQTWQMYKAMCANRDHYARSCDKLTHRAITAEMERDRARDEVARVERINGSLMEEREILLQMLRERQP